MSNEVKYCGVTVNPQHFGGSSLDKNGNPWPSINHEWDTLRGKVMRHDGSTQSKKRRRYAIFTSL